MAETKIPEGQEYIYFIEEKGNLEHAIRCTKQAKERAEAPWLKEACAFRLKMLRLQQAKKQKQS